MWRFACIIGRMLSAGLRRLTNLLYGTPRAVSRFLARYPDEDVLAAGATKARVFSERNDEVQRSLGWATARRASLILSQKRLICGDWNIPLDSIDSSSYLRLSRRWSKALVLRVHTKDAKSYQFGLSHDEAWLTQNALPAAVEDGHITFSKGALVWRLMILAYIAWFFWRRLG